MPRDHLCGKLSGGGVEAGLLSVWKGKETRINSNCIGCCSWGMVAVAIGEGLLPAYQMILGCWMLLNGAGWCWMVSSAVVFMLMDGDGWC